MIIELISNNCGFIVNLFFRIKSSPVELISTVYNPSVVYKYLVYNLIPFHKENVNLSNNTIYPIDVIKSIYFLFLDIKYIVQSLLIIPNNC